LFYSLYRFYTFNYDIYFQTLAGQLGPANYNKLHEIHSLVGKNPYSSGQNRKEQVFLTRCRISHSRLTHSYLLNNEERSECIPCNSNYSLKHVLIDSVDVADFRQTFCNVNNLSNLFTNVAGDTILQFLKEINLYTKKNSFITYVLNIWFLSF
jgi:hypothetical protein